MALRDDLFGSGISAAAGIEAMEEAAAEPVDIVLSAIVGAAGLRATAAAIRSGQRHRARQQGVPDLRRQRLHGAGARAQGARAARRFRAQRALPADRRARPRRHPHLHADGVRRAVPHLAGGAHPRSDAATGGRPSHLVDGREDLRRFGDAHEQGAGADRGASPVRSRAGIARRARASAVGRARAVTFRDGSIHAELGAADMRRPIGYCLHWPERAREPVATLDLAARRATDVRAGGQRALSGARPCNAGAEAGRRRGDRAERRERGRGGGFSWQPDRLHRNP